MPTSFNEQNLGNTAWAFAALGVAHFPLSHARSIQALPCLVSMRIQSISNMVWSFATSHVSNIAVIIFLMVGKVAEVEFEAHTAAEELSSQNLANIAWSCAALPINDDPVLAALAMEARLSTA